MEPTISPSGAAEPVPGTSGQGPDDGDGGRLASPLSRRGFLRAAGVTGLAGVAATVAACQAASAPQWNFGGSSPAAAVATVAPSATPTVAPSVAPSVDPSASASPSVAPSPSLDPNLPAGWTAHDVAARESVRRYIGNLAPALQGIYGDEAFAILSDILGVADNYPELAAKPAFVQVPQVVLNDILEPLTPETDGDVKVFRLTVDEIEQAIDELKPTVPALGYNKATPGPTMRVTEGDKVRAIFTNNLTETTGVHFHGVEFENFFMDGVPFVTQKPIPPGESFTYEFTASRPGTLMYHSHHNATDQVGRGLLGGFIVDPKKPTADDKYDREYNWISNDVLGGFTINGHGFPAVVPILAAVGETVRVRFMNEGIMYHPFHSHGNRMKVVARDGYPLGSNAYNADTITVGPGERWDVNITPEHAGVWAFHCHILPHVEGADGMFGMVNTLFVVPKASDIDAVVQLLLA